MSDERLTPEEIEALVRAATGASPGETAPGESEATDQPEAEEGKTPAARSSTTEPEPAEFPPLEEAASAPAHHRLAMLLDVPLEITVVLGRARLLVRDILALGPGSVVELDHAAGEPVDLLVNGHLVARGEVVVVDELFAVRIKEILSRAERLRPAAGGRVP